MMILTIKRNFKTTRNVSSKKKNNFCCVQVLRKMSKEKEIEETWEYIAKHWSERMILSSINEWQNILLKMEEHDHHPKTKKCSGCSARFCECMDGTCITYPLCYFCDESCRPFLANPINFIHVKKYLPDKLNMIFRLEDPDTL